MDTAISCSSGVTGMVLCNTITPGYSQKPQRRILYRYIIVDHFFPPLTTSVLDIRYISENIGDPLIAIHKPDILCIIDGTSNAQLTFYWLIVDTV